VHLTALVENPEHVCCRYRLTAFRPWLERAGHRLELWPHPRTVWCWLRLGRRLQGSDVVILQRRLLSRWQLALLRRAARRLVFDFDDAVFLRDSYAVRGPHSARRLRRFTAIVRAADDVVAGNRFLHGRAVKLTDARRVRVIPTCIDPQRYPLAGHTRAGDGVELVWVGSASTLQGLRSMEPMLDGLGRARPGLRLKLICDQFFDLRHLPVIPFRWTEASEAAAIAGADIGISWVPNDLWSRGKCGLKVLQYMAAGLPVVANPVGVQADLIAHGETGLLAKTPEQWTEAVVRLAADPALRRHMGQAGRRRVERHFGVAGGAAAWIQLLGRVQERRAA
jgi:glycosyltransferase involved in cell wall biosynthesis